MSSTITFGVDEAGRGPILGPMAIAVVGANRSQVAKLRGLGAADSKEFGTGRAARQQRADLAALIRNCAPFLAVELVDVETIDRYTFRGQLNQLERDVVLKLLSSVGAQPGDRIICDGARMFAPLRDQYPRLRAVDRGESAHVTVAAASVLAKDARDQAFEAIRRRYEQEFGVIRGGGYVNARTRDFLTRYADAYGQLPPEARKSWGAPKQLKLEL